MSTSASRAAKRFYATFYQWSTYRPVHVTRVRPHAVTTRLAPGRAFSASTTTLDSGNSPVKDKQTLQKKDLHRSPDVSNTNISADLSSHLRLLMRKVPHSAVVVTATIPSSQKREYQMPHMPNDASAPGHMSDGSHSPAQEQTTSESRFRGMTLSSFNTISLSPPLITFNVRLPSETYTALKSSGCFLVHLLHASSEGAFICDSFSKGNAGGSESFAQLSQLAGRNGVRVFSGSATDDSPLLAGQGVMKVLRCRVREEELAVGDHVVVVGEVLSLLGPKTEKAQDSGLVYGNRAYRGVGEPLEIGQDAEGVQQTLGLGVRRGDEVLS